MCNEITDGKCHHFVKSTLTSMNDRKRRENIPCKNNLSVVSKSNLKWKGDKEGRKNSL